MITGPVVTVRETETEQIMTAGYDVGAADAPATNSQDVTQRQPITRSRLNLVLCIVLAINALLQFIAIFTPGWNTTTGDNSGVYESVYYRTVCVTVEEESECETKTYRRLFSDRYDASTDASKPSLVLENNLRVRHQMNVQISWIIVVGATIFQFLRYIRTKEFYPKLIATSTVCLIIACSFMYQALYEAFSRIDFSRRAVDLLEQTTGFPYSVFFYAIAFVQTCASTFLIAKQTLDCMHYLQQSSAENQRKYEEQRKRYDAEVERLRRSQYMHAENTLLEAKSRGSRNVDRHPYCQPSPRQSPRPSPSPSPGLSQRNSDTRTHFQFGDHLDRSHTGYDEHGASSQEHSILANNHTSGQSPRPSPSPSPRLSPRYSDERARSRYMELLERSREGHDNHAFSLQDRSISGNDHNRLHEHYPKPRDQSPRTYEHSPESGDTSQQVELNDINIQDQNTTAVKL
ncbi:uncharacterized protein LOC123550280 [Mercenaria mercenaria]|uniref:uncharacterized protein LOC123550280 n=1 Tax=Mercenaria mercenaria TaxID=6596 RepID=UPI00234E995C|nr:uncharacterized protein LOC123550280 [Mercenaria mercenaria]